MIMTEGSHLALSKVFLANAINWSAVSTYNNDRWSSASDTSYNNSNIVDWGGVYT